jgi:hypothetical protein
MHGGGATGEAACRAVTVDPRSVRLQLSRDERDTRGSG